MLTSRTFAQTVFLAAVVLCVLFQAQTGALADETTAEPPLSELEQARKLQSEADALSEAYTKKMLDLEVESHSKKVPLFKARNAILSTIPRFWATVLQHHPNHRAWVSAEDEKILEFLTDVQLSELPDDPSRSLGHHYPLHTYRITFTFRPNAHFTETVLYRDVRGSLAEPAHVSGVTWTTEKTPSAPSLLNFFEHPHQIVSSRQSLQEHHLNEMAHIIRYELWQNPFVYYETPFLSDAQAFHHDEMVALENDMAAAREEEL